MSENKQVYEVVDVDALSTALANVEWEKEVKDIPETELYDLVIEGQVLQAEVKHEWATYFFAIKEGYKQFIEQFKKKDHAVIQESRTNNTGSDS